MLTDAAFGIIPVLKKNNIFHYLLIQHHAGHWSFPKGHAELGETPLETAQREFTEETGIQDFQVIKNSSFLEQYAFTQKGQTINKTVVYFTAWVNSEIVECQAEEIQAYAWLSFEEALEKLTFDTTRQILTDVNQSLTTHSN